MRASVANAITARCDGPECFGSGFIRGDANSDLMVDLSDAIYVLSYLFLGFAEPPCLKAADSNDSGRT